MLNAFRHPSQFPVQEYFIITDTNHRAQRLSASKSVSAGYIKTERTLRDVLNAFRHPSQFPEGLGAVVAGTAYSAQRLSASKSVSACSFGSTPKR